jgi:two-component system sensor histidine kinase QseC
VPGTGLGLAIVDALAGRWGARATLSPRPGGGTRAELRFPATGAPTPDPLPTTTVTP